MRALPAFLVAASVCVFSAAPPAPAEPGAPIGHLQFRDHFVSIASGPDGPRYTVRTKEGEVVGADLDEAALRAQHPELHRRLTDSVADWAVLWPTDPGAPGARSAD